MKVNLAKIGKSIWPKWNNGNYTVMINSPTPDRDFCCFYPHIPVQARGKDKK